MFYFGGFLFFTLRSLEEPGTQVSYTFRCSPKLPTSENSEVSLSCLKTNPKGWSSFSFVLQMGASCLSHYPLLFFPFIFHLFLTFFPLSSIPFPLLSAPPLSDEDWTKGLSHVRCVLWHLAPFPKPYYTSLRFTAKHSRSREENS